MAEAIFNKLSADHHSATSAGVHVIRGDDRSRQGQLLKDNPDAATVVAVMKEIDVDVSNNVRKQLNPEIVTAADTIVLLVTPDETPEYLQRELERVVYWDITDPYAQSLEFTRNIRDQILGHVKDLIGALG